MGIVEILFKIVVILSLLAWPIIQISIASNYFYSTGCVTSTQIIGPCTWLEVSGFVFALCVGAILVPYGYEFQKFAVLRRFLLFLSWIVFCWQFIWTTIGSFLMININQSTGTESLVLVIWISVLLHSVALIASLPFLLYFSHQMYIKPEDYYDVVDEVVVVSSSAVNVVKSNSTIELTQHKHQMKQNGNVYQDIVPDTELEIILEQE